MEKSLYRIDQDLMALLSAIAEQDGEITPEQEQALSISQYELETKAVDYGAAILQLKAWEKMAADEEKRVKALKTAYKNTHEMLSKNLLAAMKKYELNEVKSATMKISMRKSTQTIIDDLEAIPMIYKKVEITPDKTAIKQAIQKGVSVKGAHLDDKDNLQIK